MRRNSKFAVLTRFITWFFMVRCVSSITPRVLADWENMTFEVLTVRESSKGKDMDILWEDTVIASVLSSFRFSLLLDIHTLTSWMHSSRDCTSLLTWCGGADFSCRRQMSGDNRVTFSYIREGCGIEDKHNRPQDRALRHTVRNGSRIRLKVVDGDSLSSVG